MVCFQKHRLELSDGSMDRWWKNIKKAIQCFLAPLSKPGVLWWGLFDLDRSRDSSEDPPTDRKWLIEVRKYTCHGQPKPTCLVATSPVLWELLYFHAFGAHVSNRFSTLVTGRYLNFWETDGMGWSSSWWGSRAGWIQGAMTGDLGDRFVPRIWSVISYNDLGIEAWKPHLNVRSGRSTPIASPVGREWSSTE